MTQPSRVSRVPSRIIEKLGIGCADYEFHGAFPVLFWGGAVIGTLRITMALAEWGHREIGLGLLAVLLAIAVLLPLVMRQFKSRVIVGKEGVLVRTPFGGPRFIEYAEIGSITAAPRMAGALPHAGLEFTLRGGESLTLSRRNDWGSRGSALTALQAIAGRIEDARASLTARAAKALSASESSGARGTRPSSSLRTQRSA